MPAKNKKQHNSIAIVCTNFDFGCVKFIRTLKGDGLNVTSIIDDRRPVQKHKSRLQQEEIEILFSGTKVSKPRLSALVKNILKFFLLRYFIFLEKLKYYKITEEFSEFKYDVKLGLLYSCEGLLSEKDLTHLGFELINIHPAKLPNYRGLDGFLWALKEQDVQGVTAYIVNSGIDTGKIVRFFQLPENKYRDIAELRKALKGLKKQSYAKAAKYYFDGHFDDEFPLIERMQNRGVMQLPERQELQNSFTD